MIKLSFLSKSKSTLVNIRGFTLTEVLVSVALFGVLAAGAAAVTMHTVKSVHQSRLSMTRDQIVTQIRMTASSFPSVILSMKKSENVGFYDCVCGVGSCSSMQKTSTGDFLPFTLYDVTNMVQSPTYYDDAGMPCNSNSSLCKFRVQTKFFAQCKPNLVSGGNQNPNLTCNGTPADFLAIMYTIDENPASLKESGFHFRPITGPVYVQVSDLSKEPGACP